MSGAALRAAIDSLPRVDLATGSSPLLTSLLVASAVTLARKLREA